MNGGFLINNIAGLVTPTCAYANALFPAANLIDTIPSVAYRSTGGKYIDASGSSIAKRPGAGVPFNTY